MNYLINWLILVKLNFSLDNFLRISRISSTVLLVKVVKQYQKFF